MITGLREDAEPSNDVRNVLCDITSTCHMPDYHEATKIPVIVQDRHNDDIYQDIRCSWTITDSTSPYRLEGVRVVSTIDRSNRLLRWHVCSRDIAYRSSPLLSALGILYDDRSEDADL